MLLKREISYPPRHCRILCKGLGSSCVCCRYSLTSYFFKICLKNRFFYKYNWHSDNKFSWGMWTKPEQEIESGELGHVKQWSESNIDCSVVRSEDVASFFVFFFAVPCRASTLIVQAVIEIPSEWKLFVKPRVWEWVCEWGYEWVADRQPCGTW